MKKLLLPIIAVVLTLSCAPPAQRISFLRVPSERAMNLHQYDVNALLEKYAGHDGVYLEVERTIEHTGSQDESLGQFFFGSLGSDWKYIDLSKTRYVVINPEATWLTHVSYYAMPDQLYVVVANPDGTVRRYGLAHLKKEKEGDSDVYRFIFPDIRRGSIVEIGEEWSHSVMTYLPPLEHTIRLQYRIPCEKRTFSFAYPDWWTIKVKNSGPYSTADYSTEQLPEKKKTVISYSATDIPAIAPEPYCPYFTEVCKHVKFKVTSLRMGGRKHDRSLDWPEVAESVYDDMIKPAKNRTTEIGELAAKVTKGCESDYARLTRVVDYVRDSLESTYSFKKLDVKKVIREKKGGVGAITGLTCAMLKQLGIPSSVILLHSAEQGYWDETYVSYGELRYPAVRVELDGEFYVIFPTIKDLPLEHTPQMFQGQRALVVDQDGVGTFWTVPRGNRASNTTDEEYRLTIGENGLITVEENRIIRGYQAYTTRKSLSDLTQDELEDAVKDMMTYSEGEIALESYDFENLNLPDKPLILNMTYNISNLVTITPEEVIFHASGLFAPISGTQMKFDPEFRQLPIAIHYNEQYNKSIEINYPSAWQAKTDLPPETAVENLFGSFTAMYETTQGQIRVNQKLALNQAMEPKEKYPQLLELVGDPSLHKIPTIVFSLVETSP